MATLAVQRSAYEARKRSKNHGDCGSPLFAAFSEHAGREPSRVRLVQLCFDFYMIEAKPENLMGDRAYNSDALDDKLRSQGTETIATSFKPGEFA